LISQPVGVVNWRGPYIASADVPKDRWGSEIRYRFPGGKDPARYDLWSVGPDKINGTNDDAEVHQFYYQPKTKTFLERLKDSLPHWPDNTGLRQDISGAHH